MEWNTSIIGVGAAILGNILISLALNVQKYAHNRLLEQPTSSTPATYLTSKYWWLGVFLMMLGECGNFAAYGFAPAVLVAPLGTVALVISFIFYVD
jgi:hypothetical protein